MELGSNSKIIKTENLVYNGSLDKSSSEEYLQSTADHKENSSHQYRVE